MLSGESLHSLKKTILESYKEELELYGIDISKVIHTTIDDPGIIQKSIKYVVDFYETNDAIYVLVIKNIADEGVVEQLEIREKIFKLIYNKPIKLFLIANSIDKSDKEKAEKVGITVIAGIVVEEEFSFDDPF